MYRIYLCKHLIGVKDSLEEAKRLCINYGYNNVVERKNKNINVDDNSVVFSLEVRNNPKIIFEITKIEQ